MSWTKITHKICTLLYITLFAISASAATSDDDSDFSDEYDEYDKAYDGYNAVNDPFEGVNRAIYQFNDVLDNAVLEPVARGYRVVVPELGRTSIGNFFQNLLEPINMLNSLLQAKPEKVATSFWRFIINTSWGIGGLFDVSKEAGLHDVDEDFGQTLGYYGIDQGPYVILPLLGPSTFRDGIGQVGDAFSDPFNYWFTRYGITARAVGNAIDTREGLLELTDEIQRTALDPYATTRSLYLQRRKALVLDDKVQGKPKIDYSVN